MKIVQFTGFRPDHQVCRRHGGMHLVHAKVSGHLILPFIPCTQECYPALRRTSVSFTGGDPHSAAAKDKENKGNMLLQGPPCRPRAPQGPLLNILNKKTQSSGFRNCTFVFVCEFEISFVASWHPFLRKTHSRCEALSPATSFTATKLWEV